MEVTDAVPTHSPQPADQQDPGRLADAPPGTLEEDQQRRLKTALAPCPHLDALAGHIRVFAQILTKRQGTAKLRDRVFAVQTDDLHALNTFAADLNKDWSAVVAGGTLPRSSGMTEGAVNKIEMLKAADVRTRQRPAPAQRVLPL